MKKVIIISIISFCAITLFAQSKPALDVTGSWQFYNWINSSFRTYDYKGKGDEGFPKSNIGLDHIAVPITGNFGKQIIELKNIFQAAYPNPQGHNLYYQLDGSWKNTPKVKPMMFKVFAQGLEYNNKGGIEPINLMASQGSTKFAGEVPDYGGLISIVVNYFPDIEVFSNIKVFNDLLKNQTAINLKGVYVVAPKNNFEEVTKEYDEKLTVPDTTFLGQPGNYKVWRTITYKKGYYTNELETWHNDYIVMSRVNNLTPFKAITIAEMLELKKLLLKSEFEAISKYNAKETDVYKNAEHTYSYSLKVLEKIAENYKGQLQLPCSFKPAHKNFLSGYIYTYWHNKKGDEEIQEVKLKSLFETNINKAYTICKKLSLYDDTKPNEMQSLVIKWSYQLPAPNTKNAAAHPSMDSRSFYMGMKNNMDWNKLNNLIMQATK